MKESEGLRALFELLEAMDAYDARHGDEPMAGADAIESLNLPEHKKKLLVAAYFGMQIGKEMEREAAHD